MSQWKSRLKMRGEGMRRLTGKERGDEGIKG